MPNSDIEQLLQSNTPVQFHPTGTSMFPLFTGAGDYAVVEPLGGRRPKRGEICVYRRPNGPLVIHRVWKNNKTGIYFVGDRQKTVEGPLPESCVLGRMTSYIKKGRKHYVKELHYRIYSVLWLWLRPLRPFLFKIGHLIKVLLCKITGKEYIPC